MKLPALFLTLLTASALANGGGYTSGVKFTGSVAPFQPEGVGKVQIMQEDLDILLSAKSAKVTVRYEMKNVTDAKVTARFGFPIETVNEMGMIPLPPGELPNNPARKARSYCRNYAVTADDRKVASEYAVEATARGMVAPFPGSEAFKGIEGWMISEVDFKPGAERKVQISYDSDYDRVSHSVSDSITTQPDRFRYRLSTGAVWHGPITRGTVIVRAADGVDVKPVQIKTPANRFKPAGAREWLWSFTDLEPTLADDIEVQVTEGYFYSDDYTAGKKDVSIGYERRGSRWFWYHRDYKASASSTLAGDKENNYSVAGLKNASDYDEDFRAWVEGAEGDGLGEALTLTLSKPAPLEAIQIRPGFGKSKELFAANNRPKSLKITLNGTHTFTAGLKDEDLRQQIGVENFSAPVKTIRLEIAEVYRGSQYRDTAIADVQLITRLNKEPKFQGPR